MKNVYREANQCADRLTKLGSSQTLDFVIFDNSPTAIIHLLALDKVKLFCNKLK